MAPATPTVARSVNGQATSAKAACAACLMGQAAQAALVEVAGGLWGIPEPGGARATMGRASPVCPILYKAGAVCYDCPCLLRCSRDRACRQRSPRMAGLFKALYFAGMVVEVILRTPHERRRRQIPKTDQRVTAAEKALLAGLSIAG